MKYDFGDVCACIGPMYDEPHCYCEMKRRGLPLNEPARAEAEERLKAAMEKIFGQQREGDSQ